MSKDKKKTRTHKTAATNRRAHIKYEILETLEAGLVLTGPEVKSLRGGKANIQEGFVRIDHEEAFLWNIHIPPYEYGSDHVEQEPTRKRKLLMNRSEISKWMGRTTAKGLNIVPLEIYFNKKGRAKVTIALGKGKRGPDRREDIKRRELDRDMRRQFAGKQKIK